MLRRGLKLKAKVESPLVLRRALDERRHPLQTHPASLSEREAITKRKTDLICNSARGSRRELIKYRKFGTLDWQISVLGLGTSCLPADDGEARAVIRAAVEGGVNYIECRYNEPDEEERICRLAGDAAGAPTRVCVKLPARLNITPGDISAFIEKRTGWLRRESIDLLMVDGLDRHTWPVIKESGLLSGIEKIKADGKVGACGFSFRDQFLYLRQVIDGCECWSFAEFGYSFMDDDHLPGTTGLSYAAQKRLAIIAAEPLKGGRLVRNVPENVSDLWNAGGGKSLASRALDWVWHHGQVSTAVVDMSSVDEVRENLAAADEAREGCLSIRDEVLISRVRDAYRGRRPVNCDTCRACMPCHNGVDAPRIFELYNDAVMYGNLEIPRRLYALEGHDISRCDGCGSCARACGRSIDIPERIRDADRLLGDENR